MNTSSTCQKAADYLGRAGRPIEQKLNSFHFEHGNLDDVLAELEHHQNPDGGFHELEPDIQLQDSSVIATSIAFQILRETGAPADHPLVAAACRFLLNAYNPTTLNWEIMPPNIDDAPHAPWWVYGGDLSHSMANPRAEILGYVHDYAMYFPDAMRSLLTASVVAQLRACGEDIEMHDLACYLRLSETKSLPPDTGVELKELLTPHVDRAVARDPAAWYSYGLQPLSVVSNPASPYAHLFAKEIPANLAFLMDQQGADGSWSPNWSWGDAHPQAWSVAQHNWRSVITLKNLRLIRAFGG